MHILMHEIMLKCNCNQNVKMFGEVLSFEEFTKGTTMKQEAWSAILYPNAYARSRYNFTATTNPNDTSDMVAYRSSGTEGGYILIFDPDFRIPTHSFIFHRKNGKS